MERHFLVSATALEQGRIWTLLTSVFSHNLLFHIFINMYVLMSFGSVMEPVLGSKRFLKFYLAAGTLSSLSHAAVSALLLGEPQLPALGASGAVSGVVVLFALLFPKERILILGLIPVPALLGILIAVGLDLWGLVAQIEGSGLPIGHGAHLGGALAGYLYFRYLRGQLRKQPREFFSGEELP